MLAHFAVSDFNDALHKEQVIIDKGYIYCRETPKFECNTIFYLHFSGKLVQMEDLIEEVSKYQRKAKRWRTKGIRKRGDMRCARSHMVSTVRKTEKKNLPPKELHLSIFAEAGLQPLNSTPKWLYIIKTIVQTLCLNFIW